jgi:hypothetical protein
MTRRKRTPLVGPTFPKLLYDQRLAPPTSLPPIPDGYDADQVFAWAVCRPDAKLEEIPCDLTIEQVIAQLGAGTGETARFDAEGRYQVNGSNVAYFDEVEHFFSWAGQKKWPRAV